MAFRTRMRQSPSKAEIAVRIELHRRGLKPLTDMVCIFTEPMTITSKDNVTTDMLKNHPKFTVPDFLFMPVTLSDSRRILPVYLDGAPHKRRGVLKRDEEINEKWLENDVEPLRYAYKGKLSLGGKEEVCNLIEKRLSYEEQR